eukprot:7621191-Prorocentrum_lima.AAC.1
MSQDDYKLENTTSWASSLGDDIVGAPAEDPSSDGEFAHDPEIPESEDKREQSKKEANSPAHLLHIYPYCDTCCRAKMG